ncbi:MAG: nucleoside hydrolase [Pseudomonadota bacterium]
MIQQLEDNDSLEIIAVGPLSNIAMVVKDRPDLLHKVEKVWVMGGNFKTPGNIGNNPYPAIDHLHNHTAEWNIWTDIEAARVVLEAGLDLYLVPLDATNSVPSSEKFVETFKMETRKSPTAVSEFIAWNYDLPFIRNWLSEDRFYFWDTLAVGIAIDQDFCKEWVQVSVTVDDTKTEHYFVYSDQAQPGFSDQNRYGEARSHYHPLVAGAIVEDPKVPEISICLAAKADDFYQHFLSTTTQN